MKRPQRTPQASTLIDGYNLMFQSVKFPDPRDGAQALQKARDYFLNYLADRLNRQARQRTWIVFDSQTDQMLPQELIVRDMLVFFSVGYNSADDMLYELIEHHTAPRKLTVVSSDHQVQKKANARGAVAIDSEEWVDAILSLMPTDADEAPPTSPTEAINRKSSPRRKPTANALDRIKKEKIELNLPEDFEEQMDQLMGEVDQKDQDLDQDRMTP